MHKQTRKYPGSELATTSIFCSTTLHIESHLRQPIGTVALDCEPPPTADSKHQPQDRSMYILNVLIWTVTLSYLSTQPA